MTKVKLNQNTRMACSRIFPSSLETRAGGCCSPPPPRWLLGAAGDPGEQHRARQCQQLPFHIEISVSCNFH